MTICLHCANSDHELCQDDLCDCCGNGPHEPLCECQKCQDAAKERAADV